MFGSVDLDARDSATGRSGLQTLVLGAQAIRGYGAATDRARILVDTLVWDGSLAASQAPGSDATVPPADPMVDRLGPGNWTSSPGSCSWGGRHSAVPALKYLRTGRCSASVR